MDQVYLNPKPENFESFWTWWRKESKPKDKKFWKLPNLKHFLAQNLNIRRISYPTHHQFFLIQKELHYFHLVQLQNIIDLNFREFFTCEFQKRCSQDAKRYRDPKVCQLCHYVVAQNCNCILELKLFFINGYFPFETQMNSDLCKLISLS